jgi:hypothetical protein
MDNQNCQTIVQKPKLVGETTDVVFEYSRSVDGCSWSPMTSNETIEAPVKNTKKYIMELLNWFNAEELAIQTSNWNKEHNYKAEIRIFIRFVPKSEVEADKKRIEVKKSKALAKKRKANELKLGKWTVQKDTLEEYASAVNTMRMAYKMPLDDGENMRPLTDPIRQLETFNKRVELHKKLFTQADVPYHDSSKANKASNDLYALIEDRIKLIF